MNNTPRRLGYIPALDGLRAVAVLMVLLVHTELPGFVSGSMGVDIFFVLSGFLITSILATEHRQTGRISLGAFYRRRVFRLMPCLLLVLIAALIISYLLGEPRRTEGTVRMAVSVLFYAANWSLIYDPATLPSILPVTWSLSVEEQFYMLWAPALAFLLWRRVPRRVIVGLLAVGAAASVAWGMYLWQLPGSYARVMSGSDTRAYLLLIGCVAGLLFAWGKVPSGARAGLWMAVAGIASIVVVIVTRAVPPLLGVGTALLVLSLATSAPAAVRRILEYPSMVWIGKVSYGLYLWHGVIYGAFSGNSNTLRYEVRVVLAMSLSFAAAALSYYTVERYFLLAGRRAPVRSYQHHESVVGAAHLT